MALGSLIQQTWVEDCLRPLHIRVEMVGFEEIMMQGDTHNDENAEASLGVGSQVKHSLRGSVKMEGEVSFNRDKRKAFQEEETECAKSQWQDRP